MHMNVKMLLHIYAPISTVVCPNRYWKWGIFIGIDTNIVVIVVSLTTWDGPSGCG